MQFLNTVTLEGFQECRVLNNFQRKVPHLSFISVCPVEMTMYIFTGHV